MWLHKWGLFDQHHYLIATVQSKTAEGALLAFRRMPESLRRGVVPHATNVWPLK